MSPLVLASDADFYGEGYNTDDFCEWEPSTVWEARLRAQWRRHWRRRDGDLYPIPTTYLDARRGRETDRPEGEHA